MSGKGIANGLLLWSQKGFYDRDEPRTIFWKAYESFKAQMNDENPESKVFMFYGIGGVGKTEFLENIKSEIMKKMTVKVVDIYFSIEVRNDPLKTLQQNLRRKYGFSFPLYAVGLAKKFMIQCDGTKIDNGKIKSYMGETADDLFDILNVLETVPGFDMIPKVMRLFGKIVNSAKDLWDKIKLKEIIQRINEIQSIEEVDKYLPMLLAFDINMNMKENTEPLIVFFDGYEHLVNEFDISSNNQIKDEWLKGDNGLIVHTNKTLWVIAGREKLKWDDSWGDSLVQTKLEGLTAEYAIEYFKAAKIDKYYQEKLYEITKGVPFLMDVCVNHYNLLKGREFNVNDFGKGEQSVVLRYVRDMNISMQKVLHKMAFLRQWSECDKEHFLHLNSNTTLDVSMFETLEQSSLVRENDDCFILHEAVADILRKNCHTKMRNDICKNLIKDMTEYLIEYAKKGYVDLCTIVRVTEIAIDYYKADTFRKFFEYHIMPLQIQIAKMCERSLNVDPLKALCMEFDRILQERGNEYDFIKMLTLSELIMYNNIFKIYNNKEDDSEYYRILEKLQNLSIGGDVFSIDIMCNILNNTPVEMLEKFQISYRQILEDMANRILHEGINSKNIDSLARIAVFFSEPLSNYYSQEKVDLYLNRIFEKLNNNLGCNPTSFPMMILDVCTAAQNISRIDLAAECIGDLDYCLEEVPVTEDYKDMMAKRIASVYLWQGDIDKGIKYLEKIKNIYVNHTDISDYDRLRISELSLQISSLEKLKEKLTPNEKGEYPFIRLSLTGRGINSVQAYYIEWEIINPVDGSSSCISFSSIDPNNKDLLICVDNSKTGILN